MKKIIYIFLIAVLFSTSCSLNQKQKNVIEVTDQVETVQDISRLANYLNLYIRSLSAGGHIYNTEIAADLFNPGASYGNRSGMWYRWEWTSQSNIGVWGTCYSGIAQANYVIENIDNFDRSELSDDDIKTLNDCQGLAYFTKAFLASRLLTYYCELYTSTNIDKDAEGTGIMIVDLYRPSADISSYPGRSSLTASYAWMFENIDKAQALLATDYPGEVGSALPTVDACKALKARMYLYMGNNDQAAQIAAELVNSGKYPLCADAAETTALWTNDSGKECIMQMYAEYPDSTPGSYNPGYESYSQSTSLYTPDWIVSAWVPAAYASTDLRFSWFRENTRVTYGTIIGNVTLFRKFPGNPALQASATSYSYLQKPKPFRIAEQYLIAAEAYALSGAETIANQFLNDLKTKRDPSYTATTYSGDALIQEIRDERLRELIGEGFRFWDLKRYGQGMQRQGCQNPTVTNLDGPNAAAEVMAIQGSDYRWTQPIPKDELDSNPQIRNQQNRGYTSE